MGYTTRYSLKVTALGKTSPKPKKIQDIIAEIDSTKPIDKKQLLIDLVALQNNETIIIEPEEVISALKEFSEEANYAFDENGDSQGEYKWYEHEKEIKAFSKEHPNWLFTLSGEGEESSDIWKKYFVNNKIQVAKAVITFEGFDAKKLK